MIFQEPMSALNPVMRVGWQIAEGPRVHLGYSRSKAAERAVELMRRVGIPDPERRFRAYPHEFSGGMRQRVMIAIALSCEPEVILCDEPTTALDVTIQDQILRLLHRLCRESGVSLLFVTHDLPVVAQLCQSAGRHVRRRRSWSRARCSEVFAQPCHPYTLGLLRSAPDVEQVRGLAGAHPRLAAQPDQPAVRVPVPPALRVRGAGLHGADARRCGCCRAGGRPRCLHYERCLEPLTAEGAAR